MGHFISKGTEPGLWGSFSQPQAQLYRYKDTYVDTEVQMDRYKDTGVDTVLIGIFAEMTQVWHCVTPFINMILFYLPSLPGMVSYAILTI